jgi:hypothetical protein
LFSYGSLPCTGRLISMRSAPLTILSESPASPAHTIPRPGTACDLSAVFRRPDVTVHTLFTPCSHPVHTLFTPCSHPTVIPSEAEESLGASAPNRANWLLRVPWACRFHGLTRCFAASPRDSPLDCRAVLAENAVRFPGARTQRFLGRLGMTVGCVSCNEGRDGWSVEFRQAQSSTATSPV